MYRKNGMGLQNVRHVMVSAGLALVVLLLALLMAIMVGPPKRELVAFAPQPVENRSGRNFPWVAIAGDSIVCDFRRSILGNPASHLCPEDSECLPQRGPADEVGRDYGVDMLYNDTESFRGSGIGFVVASDASPPELLTIIPAGPTWPSKEERSVLAHWIHAGMIHHYDA